MKIIKKIVIENFRSIYKTVIDCEQVNVFGGLNDTGKSNVLKALNLFFNEQTDFLKNIDFNKDYCKVALASAQRSGKKKQQIKIKIYFQAPSGFRSLKNEKEVYLEKVYDRVGNSALNYSTNNSKKNAQITRLFNKIKFFYIPALKGADVMQYLLGMVGQQRLIPEDKIIDLNSAVNANLSALKNILVNSQINIKTTVGLPVLLQDFWEKLTLNTELDHFENLENQIQATQKGKKEPLKSELYQVPITMRGEGIKSKYIPPLLKWIQKQTNNIYVWGIDEPENSLEFRKADELSKLYFSEYGLDTQIFLTTHAFSFLFPPDSSEIKRKVFRCFRNDLGATQIRHLDENLLAKDEQLRLADELGALEVQKKIYEEWKNSISELESSKNIIQELKDKNKPALLVEGKADKKILETAWEKLYAKALPFEISECGGAGPLQNFIKNAAFNPNETAIALWDCDSKGYGELKGLFDRENFKKLTSSKIKHSKKKIHGFVLPTPPHRKPYTNVDSEDPQFQWLEIEHYFTDKILTDAEVIDSTINSIIRLKKNRDPLLRKIHSLDKSEFLEFEKLFQEIESMFK